MQESIHTHVYTRMHTHIISHLELKVFGVDGVSVGITVSDGSYHFSLDKMYIHVHD